MTEEGPEPEPKKQFIPESRPFNPLFTYAIYLGLVLIGYILFWTFHYPALIAFTLLFVIIVVRDTVHIIRTYEVSFARKASVVNLGYSLVWFVVLVVNGLALTQGQPPLILPQYDYLASWSPMFILGGVFGIANIKRMYGPEKRSFSYP
jgi:hypothetical protein